MRQSTQRLSRYMHLTRVLLVAICIGLFCAPQTLADSGSRLPLTLLGADAADDLTTGGSNPFGHFSWSNSETASAHTAAFAASPGPVAVSPAPVLSSCAPELRSFGFYPVYWYELLNNGWNNTSCTSKWVFQNGYQPSAGNPCTLDVIPRSTALVVFPNAGTFYQDFFVPSNATGPLEVELRFQTRGNGTHWDRIYVALWEGNTLQAFYGFPSQNNCGVWNYSFYGNYAGKNLRLQVTDGIVTSGVTQHIESIRLVSYLP